MGYHTLACVGSCKYLVVFACSENTKTHDLHTYKEIIAFLEGRRLDELQKQQEIGKRHYQHLFVELTVALVGLAVVLLLRRLLFGF